MSLSQFRLFGEDERLGRLSGMGDPLIRLEGAIDWEAFRPVLEGALRREGKGPGGRPAYDYVMMFKVLILQQCYGLSDDRCEFMVNDRLSFQRFLGLTMTDRVPDAKTIWHFRERLTTEGAAEELFALFASMLADQGLITRRGSIVDASFVEAPRQRNSREDNAEIKKGNIPESWAEEGNAHRMSQKDTDARWTKKNATTYYGHKDHVKVDRDSKLIAAFSVTPASTHDSRELPGLVDESDEALWADSAYVGADIECAVRGESPGISLHVCEKGTRSRPLDEGQKASNREKSRVRCRVEHVFGHMTNSMGGMFVRCIGIARATTSIALKNLAYNMNRVEFLTRARAKGVA